jgi:hypothetical protein
LIRLAALLAFAPLAVQAAEPEPIAIRQEAVAPDGVQAAHGLTLTGAWRLSSGHPGFGGFSGLAALDGELILLSDAGAIVRWKPGAADATIAALPEICRNGAGKHAADAEAMVLAAGAELRIALERGNRLCAFGLEGLGDGRTISLDAMMPRSGNRGIEAMANWPGQGTALIAEASDDGAHKLAWFAGDLPDRQCAALRYAAPDGFKPGDAAFLPDGRLLVVNRRFGVRSGRTTSITLSPPFVPAAGADVGGAEIARIERSPLAANYEGVAIETRDGGATIWLISDDNFSNPKGTMLLRFELDMRPAPELASAGTKADAAR